MAGVPELLPPATRERTGEAECMHKFAALHVSTALPAAASVLEEGNGHAAVVPQKPRSKGAAERTVSNGKHFRDATAGLVPEDGNRQHDSWCPRFSQRRRRIVAFVIR